MLAEKRELSTYYFKRLSFAAWYHPAWIITMQDYHRFANSFHKGHYNRRRDKLKKA